MNIIIIIIGLVVVVTILGGLMYRINFSKHRPHNIKNRQRGQYEQSVNDVVNAVFDDDFREELKNRGKLHFETILNDNAMFLKQDLELTTTQIHDYLKDQINKNLTDEFKNYRETIEFAKNQAVETIKKTQKVLEDQQKVLIDEIAKQFESEKKILIDNFQNNMAEVVNNYLLKAVGGHINLNDQLEAIITDLEANKKDISEDINEGS